ncbi:MAG: glycerol-3-phosphate dehydrogenase/oxidase [Armatimonadota bacterium]
MDSRCDLLVIGGGINGLGIALEAARRGLSVVLAERADFGGGTTSASSRLIHGGLRYLQYGELDLVRESLRERGRLARMWPHLIRPIELLIPTFRSLPPPGWKLCVGLACYDLLARDPLFARPRRLSRDSAREREPGLSTEGLQGGFAYGDGQLEFPERLCAELALQAREEGAELQSHTAVTALLASGRRVEGARLEDRLSGVTREVRARLVLNAAGPWVDAVNALLPEPPPRRIGGTSGTHLVLPPRPGGPRGALYAAARKDGRPFFLLPWDGRLLVGTTDVRCEGDPDALRTERWEVEYLLAETNRLFPDAAYTDADVALTTVGIRPLPASTRAAAAITRRHFVVDHAQDGLSGLASVVGGKLTTYRSLAEICVSQALRILGHAGSGPRSAPPDADNSKGSSDFRPTGLSQGVGERLARLYGPRAAEVARRVDADPELGLPLVEGHPAIRAEVRHAVESEGARTVEDVLLRRMVLLPPPPGAAEAVRRIAPELPELVEEGRSNRPGEPVSGARAGG